MAQRILCDECESAGKIENGVYHIPYTQYWLCKMHWEMVVPITLKMLFKNERPWIKG